MNAKLIDQIKPGNSYEIIQSNIKNIVFNLVEHKFPNELIENAKLDWNRSPGSYDSTIMGVRNIGFKDKSIFIEITPVKYSIHRYIATSIRNGIRIPESDRIYPIGVASISYFTNGMIQFLLGLKRTKMIDGGKLEFIPQGFCNQPEPDNLESYVQSTILRELQEELKIKGSNAIPNIQINRMSYLGLIFEKDNLHYGIQVDCELSGEYDSLNGLETEEHERIILVDKNELEMLIDNPTDLLRKKIPRINKKEIEIPTSTKALLYCYLRKSI